MTGSRRRFFQNAAGVVTGLFSLGETLRAGTPESTFQSPRQNENGRHHSPYGSHGPHPARARAVVRDHALPMVAPDVADLAHEMDASVKVFQVVAGPAKRTMAPFKRIESWGDNASWPTPTHQA